MRTLIFGKILLFIGILFLGIFLRVYRLAEFPVQLNHDEISQLYDAISIAQTGRDIYGNFLPTIFPSVNDFKAPFYTYSTSLIYLILGNREWIIRLTGVLFSIMIIPAVYLFTKKLLGNSIIAMLASFFIAISPSEIFFSRKSFENTAGIFFMIVAFYLWLISLERKNSLKWLYMAILSLAAGMYTYFSHAIIIPLLAISFIFIFRDKFIPLTKYLKTAIFGFLLIVPLIVIVFFNSDSRYRSRTVFIIQDANLGTQLNIINQDNRLVSLLLRYKTIINFSFNRYLDQFNPSYIFVNGLDLTNQRILNVGPVLLSLLPLVVLGLIYLIKNPNHSRQKKFIFCWLILGTLPSGLTFEGHSPHRSVMVFTMLNIIAAAGAYFIFKELGKHKKWLYLTVLIFIPILVFNVIYFLHMYFVNFPFEKSQYLQYPFKQIALFAWSEYPNYDSIIFDPKFGDIRPEIGIAAHYYIAYYGNVSPAIFQKEYHAGTKPRETIFKKFSIREIYWPTDKDLKNTLIIASPWSVPEKDIDDKTKIIKRFNFYNGKTAFYAIKL